MVEDTQEKAPSQKSPSDAEKTSVPAAAPGARPAAAAPSSPRPATVPPRAPAPAAAPQPAPQPKPVGRRTFIKIIAVAGAILSLVPFVPWGNFLLSTVSSTGADQKQTVVLDMNTPTNRNANGAVAGKTVNVNDLTSFPPNGSWLITYPTSGDLTVDSENPDSFQKYQLIRLPEQLGGSDKSAAAFVAFSKVCVHLWCSPNYDPIIDPTTKQRSTNPNDETYQCPCHGSIYEVPDGLAIARPAHFQPAPTNAIPMLTLTADSNGDLVILPPVWDVDHNGVLGFGRNYQSYDTQILPAAKGTG